MMIFLYVLLAVVVLIPLIGVLLYNTFVRARNMVEEGWSGIDVQLKRRSNLIPNLLATVKGYAAHEKEVWRRSPGRGPARPRPRGSVPPARPRTC